MIKIIFILLSTVLFSGCVSNPVNQITNSLGINSAEAYRVSLPYSMNNQALSIDDLIKPYMRKRKPASASFINQAHNIKFVNNWLNKDSNKSKAMFNIDPVSCNSGSHRYSSWNYKTNLGAITSAKNGCDKVAKKMGVNCKCRLIALNDTFFYAINSYKPHIDEMPWFMEVVEGGNLSRVSGMATGLSGNIKVDGFSFNNKSGRKVCTGKFDFHGGGSKGDITINCFNGRLTGKGKVIKTEYDEDLRMYSGTALVKIDTGEMRIVYGPNALKIK